MLVQIIIDKVSFDCKIDFYESGATKFTLFTELKSFEFSIDSVYLEKFNYYYFYSEHQLNSKALQLVETVNKIRLYKIQYNKLITVTPSDYVLSIFKAKQYLYTMNQLSLKLDLSESSINRLLKHNNHFNIQLILKLSNLYSFDPTELLSIYNNYTLFKTLQRTNK